MNNPNNYQNEQSSSSREDLIDAIDRLNENVERLIKIFQDTEQEIIEDYQKKRDGVADKLEEISGQNAKIAEGILAIADHAQDDDPEENMGSPVSPPAQKDTPFPDFGQSAPTQDAGSQPLPDEWGADPVPVDPAPPAAPTLPTEQPQMNAAPVSQPPVQQDPFAQDANAFGADPFAQQGSPSMYPAPESTQIPGQQPEFPSPVNVNDLQQQGPPPGQPPEATSIEPNYPHFETNEFKQPAQPQNKDLPQIPLPPERKGFLSKFKK